MRVLFREKFHKDLRKPIDRKVRNHLETLIQKLEKTSSISQIPNMKKMEGYKNFYRIRMGVYRIGCVCENNEIRLVRFLHRKDIYKKFP